MKKLSNSDEELIVVVAEDPVSVPLGQNGLANINDNYRSEDPQPQNSSIVLQQNSDDEGIESIPVLANNQIKDENQNKNIPKDFKSVDEMNKIKAQLEERKSARRTTRMTIGELLMEEPPEEQVSGNNILPPCKFGKEGTCDNCNQKVLSKEEFNQRVNYQVFKLEETREKGIVPLTQKADTEEEISSEFLRNWIKKKIECKFLMIVAMYNESCEEFSSTLEGILDNLQFFLIESNDPINKEEIGCVFIIDGIEPFMKTFLKMDGVALNKKKCFRKNFTYMSQFFNLDVIKDHFFTKDLMKKDPMYEFELMRNLVESGTIKDGQEIAHLFCQKVHWKERYSLNFIFCVKQLNKRKLNTHRWFFEGFCSRINPKYVMLLDVGTKPMKDGLYLLYDAMEKDKRIAGCCGEIIPECRDWNPIVHAQVVEYKFSHIMDKGLESIIGYVSVLPGAYSAYRWECLNDNDTLNAYFFSQRTGGPPLDLFKANMYLAEDRILCLELMCQKDRWNILRYVKGSFAETDVPSTLNELMAQRRRWVNGSWFSMIYTIKNCNRIGNSKHSIIRKTIFRLLMFYYSIVALFNWVLVGAFYLAFTVALKRNLDEISLSQDKLTKWSTPLIFFYGTLLAGIVILSFAVKPRKVEAIFRGISLVFGLLTYTTLFLTLFFIFRGSFQITNPSNWSNQLSALLVIITAFMITVIIFLNLKSAFMPVLKGIPSFLFMTGTYVNIFMIYSICNIHDCSWGNRPDKQTEEEKKMVYEYKNERTRWVIMWLFCNGAFAYFLNIISSNGQYTSEVFIDMVALVAYFVIGVKFIGGLLYVFDEWCCHCLKENRNN